MVVTTTMSINQKEINMTKLTLLGTLVAGALLFGGTAMAGDLPSKTTTPAAPAADYSPNFVSPYAKAEYQYQYGRDGQADGSGVKFTLGNKFNENFSAEISNETMQNQSTKALSSLAEVAVIPSVAIYGGLTGYARVATGAAFISGSDSFNYYSVEPGVKYAIGQGTSVKVAYRYRDAYDNTANSSFQTSTARFGVEHALNKNLSVGVQYDRSSGDSKFDAVLVGLNAKF
jgi:opacity protein-like surface antigen